MAAKHGFTSPLRYPGGKGRLAPFFKSVIRENNLLDGDYVEVYAGGAGIAWPLLFGEYVQHIHINDINKSIYSFWRSVLQTPEGLCRLIYDVPVTVEEWKRQRAIQQEPAKYTLLELGFSTFFLNRTNRSGIIGGGVIGGKAQAGEWKLDARFNKLDLIRRIQRLARYADRIKVYNMDAAKFMAEVLPKLPPRALVYLDPPYFAKGNDVYENHYAPEDHSAIAALVAKLAHPWIVSYDDAPEIANLYSDYRKMDYRIHYSAQSRYSGAEVMFFSQSLVIPRLAGRSRCPSSPDASKLETGRHQCNP
ncbi:MAG: DNA adenine methylase [Dehalococcoidia bacterium]|nr:DNA adenine methylase [Dehalococcoidia bacterium]